MLVKLWSASRCMLTVSGYNWG